MKDFNRLMYVLIILISAALAYKWIDNQGDWVVTDISRKSPYSNLNNNPNGKFLFNKKTGEYK